MSMLSLIGYLHSIFGNFNYNHCDAKSILFSWRISSLTVSTKGNYFKNKPNKLQKYLEKSLKIHKTHERIDILPATHYYDTDIGGLNIHCLITTKLNKTQDHYMHKIQNLIKNELSNDIKKIWNIPSNEEVNCYRIKAIENTKIERKGRKFSSISMVSTTDNINKMRKKSSLSTHIKVNSDTLQIHKIPETIFSENGDIDDDDDERVEFNEVEEILNEMQQENDSESSLSTDGDTDDGVGTSTTPRRGSKEKKKEDFIALQTMDKDELLTTPKRADYEHGFSLASNTSDDFIST